MYSGILPAPQGIFALPIVQWLNIVLGITMLLCIFFPMIRTLVFKALDAILGHVTNLSLASVSSSLLGGLAALAAQKPATPTTPVAPTTTETKTTS